MDTSNSNQEERLRITNALAEPFDTSEIKWKPAVVSGNRAMALAFIDARCVMDRLDEVVGPLNWQDDYEFLSDGNVVCRLRVRIDGEWVQKVDVGGPSEQPDGGDRIKAGVSDALKRAAVKFGIGRFLYRLPSQWVDYDPQRRQFLRPPSLPASLTAKVKAAPAPPPAPKPAGLKEKALAILNTATDLASLQSVWKAMSKPMREETQAEKDALKAKFQKEVADAATDGVPAHS